MKSCFSSFFLLFFVISLLFSHSFPIGYSLACAYDVVMVMSIS